MLVHHPLRPPLMCVKKILLKYLFSALVVLVQSTGENLLTNSGDDVIFSAKKLEVIIV